MSGLKTAWIGQCHLIKGEGDAQECFEIRAAAFCRSREEFESLLNAHIASQESQSLWVENVSTAIDWLTRYGYDNTVVSLAKSVHDRNRIAFGQLIAVSKNTKHSTPVSYLAITEHEIETPPDQSGISFWDREWITPGLKNLLFSQPQDGSRLNTYCIINASLRKHVTKVFDLDSSTIDVPIQCLFKGEAAETLKEVAPYLVDMTLPEGAWNDQSLVPDFHKELFVKYWGRNSGVFVRTSASFAEVWKHFRKFTKAVMQEDGRHVFFLFHDPRVLPGYLQSICENAGKVRCFCTEDQGAGLHFLVERGDTKVFEAVPNMAGLAEIPRQRFVLSYADFQSQAETEKRNRATRIASRIKRDFADELAEQSLEDTVTSALKITERFNAYGFTKQEYIHFFVAWSIFFGEGFEEKDPQGLLQEICCSPVPEDERFVQFKNRFDSFTAKQMEADRCNLNHG